MTATANRADVVIVGAGVVGCAAAWRLARHRLTVAVIEAGPDVAVGATKANSGIIHAGFDAVPGSLKAAANVRGNAMFDQLARELEFPFRRNGSLVLAFREDAVAELEALRQRGIANGVPGLRILDRDELRRLEPAVGRNAVAALHAPTGGIAGPYEFAVALAENAAVNGVAFHFDRRVETVEPAADGYRLVGEGWEMAATAVINAAGIHADELNNVVSTVKRHITPRAGQYCLLDKVSGGLAAHTLFQLPGPLGKGVLVTPTAHDNLLVGPNAMDVEDKENKATHAEWQRHILALASESVAGIDPRQIITMFTGLRAHEDGNDFVIGEAENAPRFYNALGIESPGLTAAPAIGRMLEDMVTASLRPEPNPEYQPRRPAIPRFAEMADDERRRRIAADPAWGRVVCRCETVTEAEVREVIRRTPGARGLDGVKRRVRAGMGRCQGGFCSPRVMAILAEELGVELAQVCKSGLGSEVLIGGSIFRDA